MTMLWKSWSLTFWSHLLGLVGEGLWAKHLLPCCCILWFPFIWYDCEKVEIRPIDPIPRVRGGGGVCGQTISYHVAVFFTLFNMICNMTRFWQIWILTFWPYSLSPPRWWDTGLGFKITFDMFHIYCTSVCMRNFSKKNLATYWVIAKFKYLTFDPTLGVRGVG